MCASGIPVHCEITEVVKFKFCEIPITIFKKEVFIDKLTWNLVFLQWKVEASKEHTIMSSIILDKKGVILNQLKPLSQQQLLK